VDHVNLFIACFLAFLATIIKYFGGEGMIAGYNTASKAEQEYMSAQGIGAFVGNYIYFTALVLAGGYLAKRAGFTWGIELSWLLFTIVIFVMVFRAQRFAPPPEMANPKSARLQKIVLVIVAVVIILAEGASIKGAWSPHYTFTNQAMQISGAYGTAISYSAIDDLRLEPQLPAIGYKSNGINMGPILKGYFQVDKLGSCLLFLRSASGPVIIITRQDKQEPVLINMPEPAQTRELYRQIQGRVD